MSRSRQASLGRRLGRLELALNVSPNREPTWQEYDAAWLRVGTRLAFSALDTMQQEAREAEEARRYTPYPSSMLEWCRVELQLLVRDMESKKPGQTATDEHVFERYCFLEHRDVDQERERAKDFYFSRADTLDDMERGGSLVAVENYRSFQEKASNGDVHAKAIVDAVLWVKEVKQWIAEQRGEGVTSEAGAAPFPAPAGAAEEAEGIRGVAENG